MPLSMVYHYRMDYNIIKDNITDIDRVLELVKRTIEREGLTDYAIILGDSIAYSGPGGPEESLSYFMEHMAVDHEVSLCSRRVFNLAVPAAQPGDFYTMLLKLDEHGISRDTVIINLTYAEFVARDPDPPIVYWLERDLERLDPDVYDEVATHLAMSTENKNRPSDFEYFLEEKVYAKVPVLKYRDFIRARLFHKVAPLGETGDTRPWHEKPYLRDLLKQPVYQRQFDPAPFVMDGDNPSVYFLERIAERQRGKRLYMFMSPVNPELVAPERSQRGYQENMRELRLFLQRLDEEFGCFTADYTDAIPEELFTDHVHLTKEGYEALARKVWALMESEEACNGLSHTTILPASHS